MLEQLIKIADELDKEGLSEEADIIDTVIQRLGDFSNLDKTNITKDEAFTAGHAVCEEGHEEGHEDEITAEDLKRMLEAAADVL
tara:strand:- start:515 stop:766 length:252 start_codon:yes stop_codon:yes gene_type:complete